MPDPIKSAISGGSRGGPAPGPSFNLEDAYYIFFRRKWLLVTFSCLGILGVIVVRLVVKPTYVSVAKVQLSYVVEATPVAQEGLNASVTKLDRGSGLINSEIELLTSRDIAERAATLIKPGDLLPNPSGDLDLDRMAAANAILGGLNAGAQRFSDVITVSYKHSNSRVVQPVLNAVINAYQDRHLEVHGKLGVFDDFYSRKRDELQRNLSDTETALNSIMTNLNIVSYDPQKTEFVRQITDLTQDNFEAQKELNIRKKALELVVQAAPGTAETNKVEATVPDEQSDEYTTLLSELEAMNKQVRDAQFRGLTAEHPTIKGLRDQIANAKRQKAALVKEFPGLAHLSATSTNSFGSTLARERALIAALSSRIAVNEEMLQVIKDQAKHVIDFEPKITELRRKRDEQARGYELYSEYLQKAQVHDSLGVGRATTFNVFQKPAPPALDNRLVMKLTLQVLGGCIAFGLALAVAWELVFNRTMRRPADVERSLRMRLFLTIPDQNSNLRRGWPWSRKKGVALVEAGANGSKDAPVVAASIPPWESEHNLRLHADALRDRLITYFEVNNMTHKPKLVGVTSCGRGAGVSTLAGGLAAALSETGDGNVLLVDMNIGQGSAHAFYKGKPACGISDVLEPGTRADAQVNENLYLATVHSGRGDMLPKVLPKRFMHLVPKLKSSDYDYIIFDMPPISQTSVTPRLAGHMDMVLMVLESEKTGQELAKRAGALLSESRANVAAVLNKCRQYVPSQLAQEL